MIPSDIRRALAFQWPLRVRNGQGTVIPPGAVMRIVSSTAVGGQLVYTCAKPNSTTQNRYLVNGPFAIGTRSTDEGLASTLCEAGYVLYDTGTPAVNEEWGPSDGSWTLTTSGTGFTITGGITTLAGNAAVSAIQGVLSIPSSRNYWWAYVEGDALPAGKTITFGTEIESGGMFSRSGDDLVVEAPGAGRILRFHVVCQGSGTFFSGTDFSIIVRLTAGGTYVERRWYMDWAGVSPAGMDGNFIPPVVIDHIFPDLAETEVINVTSTMTGVSGNGNATASLWIEDLGPV